MSDAPDIGTPPELAWLPVDRLDVDPSYQRTLDTPRGQKLVTKIADEFSWIKFGALIAVPGLADDAGPRWNIIDGQHRSAGARRRGVGHVPAVVHREASLAEQALAFVGANRDRVAVSAQALYRARLVAGDPEALTLKRVADAAGIELLGYAQSHKLTPAGKTAAVPALLTMLRLYGADLAGMAIAAVAECLKHQPGALRGEFFQAGALYLKEGGTPEGLRAGLRRLGIRRLETTAFRLSPNSAARAIVVALGGGGGAAERGPVAAAPRPLARLGTAPAAKPVTPVAAPPPPVDAKRAAEEGEIARFLADKGATRVMALEAAAVFLREHGRDVLIREGTAERDARGVWRHERTPVLDGNEVSVAALYALVNEYRAKAGQPPVMAPVVEGVAA